MSRIATRYIDYHNLTPKMSIAELSNYSEGLVKILKDVKARDHARNRIQKLGFSKDQTYALIPIQTSGRRVTGRDPVKKLALYIKENEDNLEAKEINELARNLAETGPTDIAKSSLLKLLRKELRQLNANSITLEAIYAPDITIASNKEQRGRQERREDEGYDCPEFFTLEKVQGRLQKCDTANPPTIQNLIDIMVMLCMRPADVRNLHIDQYNSNNAEWYDPKYSWYCTGYAKNKNDEPRPFVSMEKDPLRAIELLTWIQKSIPERFPFLVKDEDGDVNVHPINNFLIPYGISSSYLRKIGSEHAIIIHEGKTRSKCNHLCKLALRHKINREASDHYGIMNSRPNIPAPKQENSEVEDIIDLYGEISDDDN
nr:15866_t:CDS:1 [Entrophospora candida]